MKQKDSRLTETRPTVPCGLELLQSIRRIGWKGILFCLTMGVVSTVISLSLTTAKISPNSLQKDSNQLAKSMRDDWRNGYEDVLSKQRELEKTVAELNARVDQLAKSIKENETRLADVQAKTPTYATIKETIDYATQTNSGLQKEAKRVLGELGVSNIRVRD